ncbi:MAG: hypothetical protein J1E39_02070 [Eubacterium sp.]|nr:hypothetical protein [Eubacterium sp.]
MRLLKLLRRKTYIIITSALRLLITAFFGVLTAVWFVSAVYAQRGYYAVGGEWIVIIGITYAIWKLAGHVARMWWEDFV